MKKLLALYGTRPEAIKMAPIIRRLQEDRRFEVVIAVTGQHRSMLDQVNRIFGLNPEIDLDILSAQQSLTDITTRVLAGLESILIDRAPDAVLVQGDTTTTMAGALAAFYARVPVFHIEAGLRTSNAYNPFPEEINRRLATNLALTHLAPTEQAARNLLHEGIARDDIHITGNSVIDALHFALAQPWNRESADESLEAVLASDRRLVLVTMHRRESLGAPMVAVAEAIHDVASAHKDALFVFPMHKNPAVRRDMAPLLETLTNVLLLEPLDYLPFARVMQRAHVILTDSGGVQEEGPALGVPVLVARETTERPEAVSAGTARLVGTDRRAVRESVLSLLEDAEAHARMANAVNPYGDGRAADRTAAVLANHFYGDPLAEPFRHLG